jgi:hypothetical protein
MIEKRRKKNTLFPMPDPKRKWKMPDKIFRLSIIDTTVVFFGERKG